LVAGLLLGICGGLIYDAANIEYRVHMWDKRVRSAEQFEEQAKMVCYAQKYGEHCLDAVRSLALENGLLCEREAKTVLYVAGMEEENMRLKGSLAEAVARLQSQVEEINDLNDEVYRLEYKVAVLEAALEFGPEAEPKDVANAAFIDFVNAVQTIDAAARIITIILL
jgi:hypothetical protein